MSRESGIGSRESGVGNREKREMGIIIREIIVYCDTYVEEFIPNKTTYSPLCQKPTLVSYCLFPTSYSLLPTPYSLFPVPFAIAVFA
ncbi:MAG: hypothetical protein F6J90_16770 [Moorea sp. SIOASIH]|uniref:hypothetical protein n=1 Tax=Moorena sp. SIOASIH TaxID=2607817 RepID=UPI0013BC54FB|nr:hypothetical protein [Moorena sp. SIOASIH]NEO37892.1 hypothetical protein [Moorena sp. SIOASIH]